MRTCVWTMSRRVAIALAVLYAVVPQAASAQDTPILRAGVLPSTIVIDGRLTEAAWESAASIDDFRQTDPAEGMPATASTRVQVLADARAIVIGIQCFEPDPAAIVSFSVRRDA